MAKTDIEMALYRHEMEKKLKESEEWFCTTLKSIGDAVIATDTKGFVTFMNPVAEPKEAIGKTNFNFLYHQYTYSFRGSSR